MVGLGAGAWMASYCAGIASGAAQGSRLSSLGPALYDAVSVFVSVRRRSGVPLWPAPALEQC